MPSELDEIGPGSLKLVVAAGDQTVERTLLEHVRTEHMRRAGESAWIIFTEAEPAAIRDWLIAAGGSPTTVFVVEFEHWSGYGDMDQEWLLRRGH